MKLLACFLALALLLKVASPESEIETDDVEKRINFNAGANLGINLFPTPYPTIPPAINQLTSFLFSPNLTTGVTPIYGFLRTITSGIYPFIANATYGILKPLAPLINGISSNLYNGLCGPPIANWTGLLWPNTGTGIDPLSLLLSLLGSATGTGTSTNPLAALLGPLGSPSTGLPGTGTTNPLNGLLSLLGSPSTGLPGTGTTNPLTGLLNALGSPSGTTSTNPLTALLNLLGGGATSALGPLAALLPLISGSTGSPTTPSNNPINALLSQLQNSGLPGIPGLPGGSTLPPGFIGPITGTVNATLNLPIPQFLALLSQLGQTPQSLLNALQALALSGQQFVSNFLTSGKTALQYLTDLFNSVPGGNPGGATNTLQGLLNNVLNLVNNAVNGTQLIPILNNLLTSLLG